MVVVLIFPIGLQIGQTVVCLETGLVTLFLVYKPPLIHLIHLLVEVKLVLLPTLMGYLQVLLVEVVIDVLAILLLLLMLLKPKIYLLL